VAVGPDVRDPAGNPLDQNGNGTPGEPADRFTGSAALGAPAVPPPPPPVASAVRTYAAPSLPRVVQDRRTTRVDLWVPDAVTVATWRWP
jgi:hypothetical protein